MSINLQPGDTIGIIGGGQLGRMLSMAAGRLGFRTLVLDPAATCPASQFAHGQIVASYNDVMAMQRLADECRVITYEFENVVVETLLAISDETPVFPPPSALAISQDRLLEKNFINQAGLKTAPYVALEKSQDLEKALDEVGRKGVIKTRRFGYDGKGQAVVSTDNLTGAKTAFDELSQVDCILEGFVDFEREVSVIGARNEAGKLAFFDPAENVHAEGILRTSTLPANLSEASCQNVIDQTGKLLEALSYVGVIGVEFFIAKDGAAVINEFAPRVHNSGHWTEAACLISQFEQHIRAIAGLPLGSTGRHSDCIMENLIGHDMDRLRQLQADSDCLIHLYGKAEVRSGRKMGHFTRLVS